MPDSSQSEIVAEVERRRFEQSQALLRVYNLYRVVLGIALVAMQYQSFLSNRLGQENPEWFNKATLAYLAVNLVVALGMRFLPRGIVRNQLFPVTIVGVDVLALSLFTYLSGGTGSGLGTLLVVTVAVGAILVPGRMSFAIAALASISILFQETLVSLSHYSKFEELFQAGLLGVAFFTIAGVTQTLSRRLRKNEIRSMTQAIELADLERINKIIVQRMRTGIILVDGDDRVRMVNHSARALLGFSDHDATFMLPLPLRERLSAWREQTSLRAAPFQLTPNTPEIRINFSSVRSDDSMGDVTVFLEDTGEVQQQAQQLKLAALGRLSASIAHEIRNPLGAVSHASQLLKESKNLDAGDSRLTDIIHNHCIRMNGVVENVLELSRRKAPSPVLLSMLDHLNAFKDSYHEPDDGGCEIEVVVEPADTELRIDASQLNQVLTNLVNNGLRYSMEMSGRRYVKLRGGVDRATERPYLDVIDIGGGVDPDKVATLFEPFVTNSPSGTGLGLYISKELCEANQARISYQRHEDGGSCFHIIFAHPNRIIG